ncbi:hypothetical protein KO481_35585 [Nocardia sp. NEAU-G5]|uniref:ESAT-6-like protein n=1 Tax=Nocardia albiluteola TaxID=2842303 RepID=A0ABS6B952_9NOCA|nr:hypothetical protein [Nocardia albiluteola]MBU3066829.1 hypothetical protein [Nocardia albiluteola]
MKFEFAAIDGHTDHLRQIITKMENTLADMQAAQKGLMAVASGAGMDALKQVAASYGTKLDNYNAAMRKLEIAIGDVAGSQGAMSQTDRNNANRFMAIKV